MHQEERVRVALERLGLFTPARHACVLALLDHAMPSPFRALAEAGYTFASGASTQQIFGVIAPRLGKRRIDREARDQVMLPLREVGILGIAYADTKRRVVLPSYWKPKSPNNLYVVTPDFQALLEVGHDEFEGALAEWIDASSQRIARLASAEAAAAAQEDERLVHLTLDHYCSAALPEYTVIFTDDADSRTNTEWAENIQRFDLPLDLASRWPDIILRNPDTGRLWIVDCVESDGEIDPVRHDEIEAAFMSRGHVIDGYTTVYRTVTRFAQRQRAMDNIAMGTHVWIMEIGGAHWLKKPLR